MEIFVINVPRCTERREQMRVRLRALGVDARVYPAVDGSTLTLSSLIAYDRQKSWTCYGSAMTAAEVACALSHYGVLNEIVQRKLPYALVLEDDVEFDSDLLEVCEALVSRNFAAWELVRLQTCKGRVREPRTPRDLGVPICAAGRRMLYRLNRHVLGAGAYLITYAGAVKLLEGAERIFLPFDHAMDRFWENGLLPYVVRPLPVRQRDGLASEIGVRGVAAFGQSRGLLRLKQRGRRLSDSVQKRLFNLCLEDPATARLLALFGLRVARTALAATAQLEPRKTPLTPSAPSVEPSRPQADAAVFPGQAFEIAREPERAPPPRQKSRRKEIEKVRGRSGVTSGEARTLNGSP